MVIDVMVSHCGCGQVGTELGRLTEGHEMTLQRDRIVVSVEG